jgi:5-methylthioadenosine/S-adenosylhomocysteine deaminase
MYQMIKGGTIISMDPDRRILDDAAMIWDKDRIIWIGQTSQIPLEFQGDEFYNARGKIILPGFINLHTHASLSVLRGLGDDTGLAPAYSPNVPQGVFLSPDDCYVFSCLGGVEAIKFGTTCIVDNYIHEEKSAQAFFDLGIRAVISERLHDADLFKIPHGVYEFSEKLGEGLLEKNLDLISKWNGIDNSRMHVRLGPHAPDTCSTDFLIKIREVANKENVGLVIHLAQSRREVKEIFNRNGKTPVSYLADLDILNPSLIAGHCIYVTDEDIALLAKSGAHVSHQSYSNAKEGMLAPINKMIDNKINIGLGTDNMSGDMIEVMRMAVCMGRVNMRDPIALRAYDVLEMATMGGARALGMENDIGSLEVGKKADFVAIDFQKAHLFPVMDPIANLIYNALGNDIELVFVDGKCLVKDGKCINIDENRLLSEAQELTRSLWRKSNNQ